jgi:Rrf2 family protein
MLQLTRAGEYAMRAMFHIAASHNGNAVNIPDISAEWDIPETFLRKLIPKLVKAGLVLSQKGNGGGLRLAQHASEISALNIVEAIEGKIQINECMVNDSYCRHKPICAMSDLWAEAEYQLRDLLANKSLDDLLTQFQLTNGKNKPNTAD